MDRPTWDQIRPGDLIEYTNSSARHVVVVLDKTSEYVKVTESGTNNKARWGGGGNIRKLSPLNFYSQLNVIEL